MRPLDLRQLRYFVAVADQMSFRKAARVLNLTEPPLSRQIKLLEDELGVQLFVREKRRIFLTESGFRLLNGARKLLEDAQRLKESIGGASGLGGSVKVGVGAALSSSIRPVALEFARRYPAIDVQYRDLYSIDQIKALLQNEIDVGFLRPSDEHPDVVSRVVIREGFQVIMPKAHPLAKARSVTLMEIADETLLLSRMQSRSSREVLLGLYERIGVTPKIVLTAAVPTAAGGVSVEAGKGIYIVPGSWLDTSNSGDSVSAVPLDEPDARVEVHVAYRRNENAYAVLRFIELLTEVLGTQAR